MFTKGTYNRFRLVELALGGYIFWVALSALTTINAAFYLYYERVGLKNAGTDDED